MLFPTPDRTLELLGHLPRLCIRRSLEDNEMGALPAREAAIMSQTNKPPLEGRRGGKAGYVIGGFFLGAVALLGTVALLHGGSMQAKEGPTGMSFRVEGYQNITLKDALTEAWKKDSTTTRAELTAWGQEHKFVDGSDLGQLETALQKWHPDSWFTLLQLAHRMQSEQKETELNVKIVFAPEGTIKSGHLYFKSGDKRFFNYIQHDCLVAVGNNSSISERVDSGVILTHHADVEIPVDDLVDLFYKARFGQQSVSDKSSENYKAMAAWVGKIGTFRGKVYLQ
jgi:hypothetical protein